MPFNIKAIENGKYVLVEHHGFVTVTELEEGRSSAKKLLTEKNWSKVLFDVTGMTNNLSIINIYHLTKSHQHVFDVLDRIGLLVSPIPERKQNSRFIENIAANRGVNLKVFFDAEQARSWLIDIGDSKSRNELIKFLAVVFEPFLPALVVSRTQGT